MHRDSSGTRRSARARDEVVDEKRGRSGAGAGISDGVDLDLDLGGALSGPRERFLPGLRETRPRPAGGLIVSSSTTAPATRITT